MYLKIILFFAIMLINATSVFADTTLFIWSKTGEKVGYVLSERPKITFNKTALTVISDGVEISYPIDNFRCITYEKNDVTSIKETGIGELYSLKNNSLFFYKLRANDLISIFSIDGVLLYSKSVQRNGEFTISLSDFNTKAFIVKMNNLTFKIVKK